MVNIKYLLVSISIISNIYYYFLYDIIFIIFSYTVWNSLIQHLNEESVDSIDSDLNKTNERDNKLEALKMEDISFDKTVFSLRTQNINIKSILIQTMQGQAILQSYKKMKSLSRKSRNIIVDLIFSEILSKTSRLFSFFFIIFIILTINICFHKQVIMYFAYIVNFMIFM